MDHAQADPDFRQFVVDCLDEETVSASVSTNESSYSGKKLSTNSLVPGRLSDPKFYEFWKNDLNADDFVLKTVSEGYQFPLISEPPSSFCENNKSMLKESDFALTELLRLEKLGCIKRVSERPYLTLPLSVVFSKKLRLVVDASRHLNPFIEDRKIKLEGLDAREKILIQGDYQTKCDLDSGYWHLALHPSQQKYVGCHFRLPSGETIYWVWLVLFLGIKDAVFIFTKILMPHRRYLRLQGIRISMYIDDQSVAANSFLKCKADSQIALTALAKAGWIFNIEKSSDPPRQDLTFLGLVNDTNTMKYYVPDNKSLSICNLIKEIISKPRIHVKILAKLMGKMQFCFKAFGPVIKLLSRSSYYAISKAKSWKSMIEVSIPMVKELSFLLEHWDFLNGFPMRPSNSAASFTTESFLCSDASSIGNCVYQFVNSQNVIVHKRLFTALEKKQSSTHRELLSFHDFFTSSKADFLKDQNIVHYTDNLACSIILSDGSRNVALQELVLEVFLAWKKLNLKVTVLHLSRSNPIIEFADFESKNFDLHDYSLNHDSFLLVNELFGPFVVDCFASKENKKCTFYFSKFEDSSASGRNFFAQSLPFCPLFVFPPVHLIIPTLLHLAKFNCYGCLIVPFWPSSIFWTFLANDGIHLNYFVRKVFKFSPDFVSGPHIQNSTFQGVQKFPTLALQFRFSPEFDHFVSNKETIFCIKSGCFSCC